MRDLCADLLIFTRRTALQLVDVDTQLSFQKDPGRVRSINLVMCQGQLIEPCPLEQILFLMIVRHKYDFFLLSIDTVFIFMMMPFTLSDHRANIQVCLNVGEYTQKWSDEHASPAGERVAIPQ